MTPKSIIRYLFAFCLLLKCTDAAAQIRDAQVWEKISLDFKLNKKTILNFNHQGRFVENASWFGLAYADIGLCRKINKKLRLGANYIFSWKRTYKEINVRHTWYAYLNFRQTILPNTTLSWRSRYQVQYSDIFTSELGTVPSTFWRNKFTITYDPFYYPWSKVSPFIAAEFYYNLDAYDVPGGRQFNRTRLYAGASYHLNKITAFELYFMNEYNYNIKRPTINYVYGIGFSRTIL